MAAVKDRLTKEINYWDHRANQLKDQELAGKTNAKINSGKARQRADELQARLQKRMAESGTRRSALAAASCGSRRFARHSDWTAQRAATKLDSRGRRCSCREPEEDRASRYENGDGGRNTIGF